MTRSTWAPRPGVLLVFPILLLTACGGGSGSPIEHSGVLQGGQPQGVDFRTPTRSGTTDAQGRFTYLPGEDVTFSVAGIEIGSAAGAPDISLFTLAGLTPPSNERMLRRALDVATRTHSPFTRAMNIELLLLELDADGNPANGLDVRNRRETLAGVSLDFDLPYRQFEGTLYRGVPDLTHNIPVYLAVAHLYGAIGIKVPAHAQTEVRYESQGAITLDTYTYYPSGALASDSLDLDGDGLFEIRSTFEYDPLYRITSSTDESDVDFDSVPEVISTSVREFDARGNQTGYRDWLRSPLGSETAWELVEIEYDRYGRPRRQVIDTDEGADGSADFREIFLVDYDARGNGVSARSMLDHGADGTDDTVSRSTYQYDARDALVARIDETDDGADGVIDSRVTWTYDYAADGRSSALVVDQDNDADGSPEQRSRYGWTYDREGNTLTSDYRLEASAQGIPPSSLVTARAYDRDRRVTRIEQSQDINGDGFIDSYQVNVITHDDVGNEILRVIEFSDADDGVVDYRVTEMSEIGAGGELLTVGSHYGWNSDGLGDMHTVQRVTSELLEDGVLHLAQWYFSRGSAYDSTVP